MKRTKVIDALQRTDYGSAILVNGWVRSKRGSKGIFFIALNDGSTIKNIQIVGDEANFCADMLKQITTGACLAVEGTLVESPAAGQASEIQATAITVLGTCSADYPMQKKGQTFEYMRQHAHMRLRTNTFGAVMRIRHNMAMAIHTYFHEHGYFYFHTPLITASDCEGAGQMFQVTTKNLYDLKKDENGSIIYSDDFFGKQASLTVSGQLEGELGATALGAIYTFGPTFRAENSNTSRHAAEFWMIEPEIAFCDIYGDMEIAEAFIKHIARTMLADEEAQTYQVRTEENRKPLSRRKQKRLIRRAVIIGIVAVLLVGLVLLYLSHRPKEEPVGPEQTPVVTATPKPIRGYDAATAMSVSDTADQLKALTVEAVLLGILDDLEDTITHSLGISGLAAAGHCKITLTRERSIHEEFGVDQSLFRHFLIECGAGIKERLHGHGGEVLGSDLFQTASRL